MARTQGTTCSLHLSSPHCWSLATGQVLCPQVEYWLTAHTHGHTQAYTHTHPPTHRQVYAQYSTTVTFSLGGVHAVSPQAHWVLYFLNRAKFVLFSLSNLVSLFLWQMAHHSHRHSQTADSTNKLISITALHASSLLIWLTASLYTSTVLGWLYETLSKKNNPKWEMISMQCSEVHPLFSTLTSLFFKSMLCIYLVFMH